MAYLFDLRFPMARSLRRCRGELVACMLCTVPSAPFLNTKNLLSSLIRTPSRFMTARKLEGLRVEDVLTIENSFFGYCEGVYLDTTWKRIVVDDN